MTDNKGYTNIKFNDKTDHNEGWFLGVYTHSRQTVYPRCSKDTQSPINKCGILMYVRADGKKPSDWKKYYINNVSKHYLATVKHHLFELFIISPVKLRFDPQQIATKAFTAVYH